MNPWILKIIFSRATWIIVVSVSIILGLIWYGYDRASDKCEQKARAAASEAYKQAAQIALQDAEVYDWHIAHNREIETRYKVITNEINVYKPVVGKCYDPIGMSIWNRTSEAATHPGLFDNSVPPTK